MSDATLSRGNLLIPDPRHVGLTTYDANDPDTTFPPIEPLSGTPVSGPSAAAGGGASSRDPGI